MLKPPTDSIYTLSLHDALPIWKRPRPYTDTPPFSLTLSETPRGTRAFSVAFSARSRSSRSEEHTSELQSRLQLVCRLLLEKKKKMTNYKIRMFLVDFPASNNIQ